jgi:predicted AlkP superfamily pyrophosphatase or phosphodiesterase
MSPLLLRVKQSCAGRLVVLVWILTASAGCGPHYVRADLHSRLPVPQRNAVTDHVVVVSVDGLRPDAIERFETPTLNRLMREGSYTLKASTIVPSKTLPSHASMLTGQSPDAHKVLWNTNAGLNGKRMQAPTVFGLLRAEGYRTAAFFSKSKFTTLQQPGTLDYSQAPGGWFGHWSSDRTVGDVQQYLTQEKPNLLFIHLGDTDRAGHASGWMSSRYGQAVTQMDAALERIMKAAEQSFGAGKFTLIVTADHGGHDYDHGTGDPRDVTIPWIAWGRGVNAGSISRPVNTVDTAATLLWLLKVEGETSGVAVVEAFEQGN